MTPWSPWKTSAFTSTPGFDILATGRALANDIRAGAIVEGGSTITQQLAKNEYFTQEQTIERKIAEIFMAFDIERHFSKDEILELYVNSIYFGDGYYGIGQAGQGYFGKSASDLTDYEATMLAGTPNAPSAYAPTVNPDLAAAQRQRQVLDKMGGKQPDHAGRRRRDRSERRNASERFGHRRIERGDAPAPCRVTRNAAGAPDPLRQPKAANQLALRPRASRRTRP